MRADQKNNRLLFRPGHILTLFLIITLPIWITPTTSWADGALLIVNSSEEVPVRTGQGTEFKIVALLKDQEIVTSLEEDGYWIRVRTATGREGWTLKRYLTLLQPVDTQPTLPDLNQSQITTDPTDIQPNQPLPASPLANFPITSENSPETDPAGLIVHLERQLDQQIKKNEELQHELATVTKESEDLRQNEQIRWFVAGAGVFLVGWLLGLLSGRTRKRKPSLLQ